MHEIDFNYIQSFIFQEFKVDCYSFSSTGNTISAKFKKNDIEYELSIIGDYIYLNEKLDKILTNKWNSFTDIIQNYCINL